MCGFAVAINWPEARATVEQMIVGIFHRGDVTDPCVTPRPDTAMCTRRLKIVDRDHATQPQASFDNRYLVSFNGEIYNYEAIIRELEAGGVPFRTRSDTEMLVNAVRVWGPQALQKFIGMYAFVVLDTQTGDFLAARDPFGIKPLYVIQDKDHFLFSSEIRPLLNAADKGDALLIPPGFLLTNKTCVRAPAAFTPPASHNEPADPKALDAIFDRAVARRLPPDLPCAVMFSGGIDSTLIAHYARRHVPDMPGYFVGREDAPDYPFARAYADKSGFDMRMVDCDPLSDETFALIDEVVATTESFEPNVIRSGIGSYLVSQAIHKDGFRVALCGEGADEIFCGYPPLELTFADRAPEARTVRAECIDLMHRVCLQRVDRCSMKFQIETRVPFLDPEVAMHALALSPEALIRDIGGVPAGKSPLRALYDLYPDQLPEVVRDRTKLLFADGSGLKVSPKDSPWKARFEAEISDADFADGQMAFLGFDLRSKEELYYMRALSRTMDVSRVPHLKGRAWLSSLPGRYAERLQAHVL